MDSIERFFVLLFVAIGVAVIYTVIIKPLIDAKKKREEQEEKTNQERKATEEKREQAIKRKSDMYQKSLHMSKVISSDKYFPEVAEKVYESLALRIENCERPNYEKNINIKIDFSASAEHLYVAYGPSFSFKEMRIPSLETAEQRTGYIIALTEYIYNRAKKEYTKDASGGRCKITCPDSYFEICDKNETKSWVRYQAVNGYYEELKTSYDK